MSSDRLSHGLRTLVTTAVLTLAVLVAPAAAAPPSPQNDALKAAPTGVRDVLANDSDPEAKAMTIASNTQPANGTASCSALGACLYTADEGFTGADAFIYTARDADGESSVGTVTVTVRQSTSPASTPRAARHG